MQYILILYVYIITPNLIMKRLRLFSLGVPILLTMLLLQPSITFSQEYLNQSPSLPQTPLRVAKDMHEVRVSIGVAPLINSSGCNDFYMVDPIDWYSKDYYHGNSITTPAFNFTYGYQVYSWLNVGVVGTFASFYRNSYDLLTDNLITKKRDSYLSFMPTVRFDWVRSNVVRLYSSIGLGSAFFTETTRNYIRSDVGFSNTEFSISADITPFGISVGRRLFFFGELSLGFNGFAKCGVGYRFYDKRR